MLMCVVCFVCELLYDVVWCVSVFAYSAFVCNVHLQLVRVWSVCVICCVMLSGMCLFVCVFGLCVFVLFTVFVCCV